MGGVRLRSVRARRGGGGGVCARSVVQVCIHGHVCVCAREGVCAGACARMGGGCRHGGAGGVGRVPASMCVHTSMCGVSRDAETARVQIPPRERTGPCLSLCPGSSMGWPHVWVPMGPPLPCPLAHGGPSLPFAPWAAVVHMEHRHGTRALQAACRTWGMAGRSRQRGSARWGRQEPGAFSASPTSSFPARGQRFSASHKSQILSGDKIL